MATHFFNIFVNLDKYLEHEQTDPFAAKVSYSFCRLLLRDIFVMY